MHDYIEIKSGVARNSKVYVGGFAQVDCQDGFHGAQLSFIFKVQPSSWEIQHSKWLQMASATLV